MDYKNRIEQVLERIELAAQRVGRRSSDIKLMAVSKLHSAEAVIEVSKALNALGRPALFGENYVQEFATKAPQIKDGLSALAGELTHPLGWEIHFIGHLQSNKAARAVELFDVIQSIDRLSLISAVASAARKVGKRQKMMLQINISQDPQKGGISEGELQQALDKVLSCDSDIELTGLMTITAHYETAEEARNDFKGMFRLAQVVRKQLPNLGAIPFLSRENADHSGHFELSMGMSQDLEVAIEEGATLVRVGTDIFGSRNP